MIFEEVGGAFRIDRLHDVHDIEQLDILLFGKIDAAFFARHGLQRVALVFAAQDIFDHGANGGFSHSGGEHRDAAAVIGRKLFEDLACGGKDTGPCRRER